MRADVFTQELADFHSSSCGLLGHVEAFSDRRADLGWRVVWCDVLPQFGRSFLDG